MLEGTGKSKTKTIQVLCDILKKKLVRFNLSSETKIEDLIGKLGSGGENSLSNFRLVSGPFSDAFENGKVIFIR